MVDEVKRPPQPVRAMVLALLMLPIALLTMIWGLSALQPWQVARGLIEGVFLIVTALLILANRLAGRWMATVWAGYGVLVGIMFLSAILFFRFEFPFRYFTFFGGFGIFFILVNVLFLWMAFPLPAERALHRAARDAQRAAPPHPDESVPTS